MNNSNMHYTPSDTLPTAFHNPAMHTTNKHMQSIVGKMGDGVNVLWCRSHLVWVVFEGSIPTCACFHSENVFVTLHITVYQTASVVLGLQFVCTINTKEDKAINTGCEDLQY